MSRYIDADALLENIRSADMVSGFVVSAFAVVNAPTADVVEVVRCKDCKYAHMDYDGDCKYCDKMKEKADGEFIPLYLPGDWFCAYGERKA